MRSDRPGDIGLAEIGFLPAELRELRFAIPNQILCIAAQKIDQLFDLSLAWRLFEILADRGFYSLAAQQFERLARFATARVVSDRDGHCIFSHSLPPYHEV